MPPQFVIALLIIGSIVLIVRARTIHQRWAMRMAHIASTRGWRMHPSLWRMPWVDGEVEGCRVVVAMPWRIPARHDRQPGLVAALTRRRREQVWTYARAVIELPRPLRLTFEPEAASSIGRMLSRRDLTLGDPGFDDVVRIAGDETILRATFDGPTRWAVRLLTERGGRCDGHRLELSWQHDDHIARDAEAIDCALDAARRLLSSEGTTRSRLARIAAEDAKPAVRHGALTCLIERHRAAAETTPTARRALEDDDPAVRLAGARHLEHLPTLEALLPPGHPMPVRVAAVEYLGGSDAGRAILRRVIPRIDGPAKAAALAALRAAGGVAVGGLALAEVPGGGLALADGDGGGLSRSEG